MIRVYRYRCRSRIDAKVVGVLSDAMRATHVYYNRLVELENEHREILEAARAAASANYAGAVAAFAAAEGDLSAAVERCQAAKAAGGSADPPAVEAGAVRDARAKLSAARVAMTAARRAVHASAAWKAARDAESARYRGAVKAAYNASPVWWGNKLLAAEDLERAARDVPFGPLRFRRWTRSGRVGTQCQNGAAVADVLGLKDTRVRVDASGRAAVCRVRLGSDGRSPVWVDLPIHYGRHGCRPLPADGRVKWVTVVRRKGYSTFRADTRQSGVRDEWSVCVTVEVPDPAPPEHRPGAVGVDVGWRVMGDGSLRVAVWRDDAGRSGDLRIPPRVLALWTLARDLQSRRDLAFAAARDRLADLVARSPLWPGLSPEVAAELRTVRQWRSIGRLHRLAARWDGVLASPESDASAAADLAAWRSEDSGIERRMVRAVRRAEKWRLANYRMFAAAVGSAYGVVGIEALDVAAMRTDPLPEESPDEVRRHWRNAAAVGLLLKCLRSQGRAAVVEVDPAGTTAACHACRSVEEFDRVDLTHACSACGAEWDQDENAAANVLRLAAEMAGAGDGAGPATGSDVGCRPAVAATPVAGRPARRNRKGGRSRVYPHHAEVPVVG